MLSGYLFTVGQIGGPPLTENEPEGLVCDAMGLHASLGVKCGVDTTHHTSETDVVLDARLFLLKSGVMRKSLE